MQTQAEVKKVIKGQRCYMNVAGTETWVAVGHADVLHVRTRNDDDSRCFHFYGGADKGMTNTLYVSVVDASGYFNGREC